MKNDIMELQFNEMIHNNKNDKKEKFHLNPKKTRYEFKKRNLIPNLIDGISKNQREDYEHKLIQEDIIKKHKLAEKMTKLYYDPSSGGIKPDELSDVSLNSFQEDKDDEDLELNQDLRSSFGDEKKTKEKKRADPTQGVANNTIAVLREDRKHKYDLLNQLNDNAHSKMDM